MAGWLKTFGQHWWCYKIVWDKMDNNRKMIKEKHIECHYKNRDEHLTETKLMPSYSNNGWHRFGPLTYRLSSLRLIYQNWPSTESCCDLDLGGNNTCFYASHVLILWGSLQLNLFEIQTLTSKIIWSRHKLRVG